MYALKTLSVMAIAATSVFAAPTPVEDANALEARGNWHGGNRYWNRPAATAYVTVTSYDEGTQPTETAAAQPASQPASGWGAPAESAAPAASASSSPGSVSSGGDWFDIANKWRTAAGLSPFSQDSTLVANAQKTADDSTNGLQHQLNPGTFAQVLAPGDASNFESVYVGGWLCELPNSAGLNGICSSASGGWNHAGQTGHADILYGSSKKIGCAFSSSTGVWSCDLA